MTGSQVVAPEPMHEEIDGGKFSAKFNIMMKTEAIQDEMRTRSDKVPMPHARGP